MRDIDEMIEKLLDMDIVNEDNTVIFTDGAKQLIHEIAEECTKMHFWKKNRNRVAGYGRDLSAEDVYVDMLRKIVKAPTKIHMIMSARLLIPVIDQKIQDREKVRDAKKKERPKCYGYAFREDGILRFGAMVCDVEFCDYSDSCWYESRNWLDKVRAAQAERK